MHISLGLINNQKYLNPLSTSNFKFSTKICKKIEKQRGENQTQVHNQG